MEKVLEYRHNIMKVTSISSFSNIKGGLNQGCRDVYFVRALGTNNVFLHEIQSMDETLSQMIVNGKGFYRRINELPKMVSTEEAAYYSKVYEEWKNGGKQEVEIKTSACRSTDFRKILSQACLKLEEMFRLKKPQASESIVKNFLVKVWFWYDFLFQRDDFVWNERLNSKVVAANVSNWQEYLFWYGVTLTGNDVLLLQCAKDIDPEDEMKMLSEQFVLGEFSNIQIPEFMKIPSKQNETAAGNIETPVRIVMPRHEGCTTTPSRTSGTTIPTTAMVDGGNQRREKTYEELARMASSVVLILIHDNKGEVVGSGSGIMIGRNGYILTNNHVTRGGRSFSVRIEEDEQVYKTDEIIKYHSVLDLAIIRIQRELNPLPIYNGPQKLVRGQRVVAIGSPLGLFNSVSDGIISGFRKIDDVDMIQFTAPISHGSSGGAVLNMYGEVIGISTAGIDSGQNINLAMGYECMNSFIRGFV